MKIEQLVQVIEIEKTKSITIAAKNLFMSQSNLSTSIKELEKEMKQPIFIRSINGTYLTPFGENFVVQAKAAVKQFNYIKNMANLSEEVQPNFSVASYHFLFSTYIFIEMINNYSTKGVKFSLLEGSRSEVVASVSEGNAEIGIISVPSVQKEAWKEKILSKDLEYNILTTERIYAMVGKQSEFANKDIVSTKSLSGKHLVSFTEAKNSGFESEEEYKRLSPESIIKVTDRSSLTKILQNTDSYHLATKNPKAYQDYTYHEGVEAVPIDSEEMSIEIIWIKKKESNLSELSKEFLLKVQETIVLDDRMGK